MIRVAILSEGEPEGEFVSGILTDPLFDKGVVAKEHNLGGSIIVARLAREIRTYCRSYDLVTTLVDFYGFRDKGSSTVSELEKQVLEEVDRIMPSGRSCSVDPYIQLHEFEGLLFSDVEVFAEILGVSNRTIKELQKIRNRFVSPEDINDQRETSPSHRITRLIPAYQKVASGVLLAEKITLAKIRQECTRFDNWVSRLESFGSRNGADMT